jgi:hypothetical protein
VKGEACLDIVKSNDWLQYTGVPYEPSIKVRGDYCFVHYIEAGTEKFDDYIACFTLISDGLLEFQGSGSLWGESGILSKAEIIIPPTPPLQNTKIIIFIPTGVTGIEIEGSCWTLSLASPRPGAWRCMSDNQIYDPCFSPETPDGTDYVICHASPLDEGMGIKFNLTKPLPKVSPPSKNTSALALELEDGTICRFSGTGTLIPVDGKYVTYTCADGWVLLGQLQSGNIWKAEKALLDRTTIIETVEVNIRTIWQ